MQKFYKDYLRDQESAWAPSTLKSETYRLKALEPHLNKGPGEVHKELLSLGQKPYAIKTAFIRLCGLEAWGIEKGLIKKAPYAEYFRKHRNRFKHAYIKEELGITFEDAVKRIETLEEPFKTMAMDMIKTGVRLSEAYEVEDGHVIGKGGKPRKIYGKIRATAPRSTFWRKLKAVGLKPHSLRKLLATHLAEHGATAADLMKVFGWSSINTAASYLQSKDEQRLQALVEESTKRS